MRASYPLILKKFVLLTFSLTCSHFSFSASFTDSTFYYTIKPVVKEDRTDLEISLEFTSAKEGEIAIEIFRDFYGTPKLYQYLTSFQAFNGTVVRDGTDPREKIIVPNDKKQVSLRYTISYDPAVLNDYTFGPTVSASSFHVAACQWMLIVNSIDTPHTYKVKIKDPPKGWNLYASADKNPLNITLTGSYSDIFAKYWGGGSQSMKTFTKDSKQLQIFVSDKINIPVQEVFENVSQIVNYQRNLFNDIPNFFTVTILNKEDNVAGLRVENMFMCYIQTNVTRMQLYQVIAHEMFHEWLGGKITVQHRKGEPGFKHHWLTEGFTDYLAYKTLLTLGFITSHEFVMAMNRYIVSVVDNSYKNYTMQQFLELSKEGKYGTEAVKFQYHKGALMALYADEQLDPGSGSLTEFIKVLYSNMPGNPSGLSEDLLFELAQKNKLNLYEPYDKYVIKGENIVAPTQIMSQQYQLVDTLVHAFDLGFSLRQSNETKKITGLVKDSEAEKAGLKDGLDFLHIENYNRFANNWRYDLPVKVLVKENGIEKTITYFPHGARMPLKLYKPVK